MKVSLHESPARPTTNLQRTEYFANSLFKNASEVQDTKELEGEAIPKF